MNNDESDFLLKVILKAMFLRLSIIIYSDLTKINAALIV
jgi:hypothetical protein